MEWLLAAKEIKVDEVYWREDKVKRVEPRSLRTCLKFYFEVDVGRYNTFRNWEYKLVREPKRDCQTRSHGGQSEVQGNE